MAGFLVQAFRRARNVDRFTEELLLTELTGLWRLVRRVIVCDAKPTSHEF